MLQKFSKVALIIGLLTAAAPLLNSCATSSASSKSTSPSVKVDGSSTVAPITNLAASEFQSQDPTRTKVAVTVSGTGAGFKKFCAGETDINNASRPILLKEMDACKQTGVNYIELPVAYDAITVAVNPQNTWVQDITLDELKKLWEPSAQGQIKTWQQVRSSWPNRPIHLYGPGKDSGTFDYFTQTTTGTDGASRTDYTANTSGSSVAQEVAKDPDGLGYFGYGYYQASANQLRPLAINDGQGAVLPSEATVQNNRYQPYSRPVFIYVNERAAQEKPEVRAFVEYYLKNASRLVQKAGYIPLSAETYHIGEVHFYEGKIGTVFAGEPQPGITMSQLLKKQAIF
jgi:phosphate transport system substrate-binding protein